MKKAIKNSAVASSTSGPDLSAQRDAEIIPVALEIFTRVATREDLKVGSSANLQIDEAATYYQDLYRQEVVPALLRSNVQLSAVKYLFETVLIPVERLGDTFNKQDHDTEAIPLAKAILAILGGHKDLPVGTLDKPTVAAYYQKIYDEEVVPLIAKSKVSTVSYVFSLLRQPFQLLSDLTITSLEMNKEIADTMKWGGKHPDEIRIVDLDTTLKAGAEAAKEPAGAGVVDKSGKTKKRK